MFILTFGTVLPQLVTVSLTPFITRLYSPNAFGLFALFSAVSVVVSTFVTFRYEANILVAKNQSEAVAVSQLGILLAFILGVFVLIVAYFVPKSVRSILSIESLNGWFLVACAVGIGMSLNNIGSILLNRAAKYLTMALAKVSQSFIFVAIALVLGWLGTQNGLLLAQTVSIIIILLFYCWVNRELANIEFNSVIKVAKKYSDSPIYGLPTALLDVLTLQLPIILIGSLFSSEAAGQFSLAWRVLLLPASLVGVAIGQIFFQRFASVWPNSESATLLLIKAWKVLALIGFGPLVIAVVFGRTLFCFVFGLEWEASGKMAQVLAPMLFFSLIHSPTSTAAVVLCLQRKVLFIAIAVAIYRPLSIYIGYLVDNIFVGLMLYVIFEVIQVVVFQLMIYKSLRGSQ